MSADTKKRLQAFFLPVLVIVAVGGLVAWAARSPVDWRRIDAQAVARPTPANPGATVAQGAEVLPADMADAVKAVDQFLEEGWHKAGVHPAPRANDLQILRRLCLALCGTIPSLEEIREFESDAQPGRLDRWTVRLLADNRFADYFAERLARSFVGTEAGQPIIFRRDRFVDWLRQQLAQNTPYDALARRVISETGLWTDHPAANYITAAMADGQLDENKLAGRTVRAFLGQRIDCAQCHDHPFAEWKQGQFEGLAALFGQAHSSIVGVEDKPTLKYEVEDRKTRKKRVVEPAVPFHAEWMPAAGSRRERLAAWVTHPENRRFERATANRIWGLLLGKPLHAPVDDLPDPPGSGPKAAKEKSAVTPGLLDLVGGDFRRHGCDLRRMIRVIVAARAFQLDSARDDSYSPAKAAIASELPVDDRAVGDRGLESSEDGGSAWAEKSKMEGDAEWAVFPMTRLRPEQLIGAMLQSTSLRTIDQNSHLFVRAKRYFQENEFVKQYGDLGDNELDERSGTIAQALLRMNGKLASEALRADAFSSTNRVASFAGTDQACVEASYLVVLCRRPSPAERDYFVAQLAATDQAKTGQSKQKDARAHVVEDLFWSLFNSPEFAWNH